jgi:hypothetical protein
MPFYTLLKLKKGLNVRFFRKKNSESVIFGQNQILFFFKLYHTGKKPTVKTSALATSERKVRRKIEINNWGSLHDLMSVNPSFFCQI